MDEPMSTPARKFQPRGNCPVCSGRVRLRKDGTAGAHAASGAGGPDCRGTGQPGKWPGHSRQAREKARPDEH